MLELGLGNNKVAITPAQDQVIRDLATRNKTPFYLYDLAQIRKTYQALREILPERMHVLYSMKANPHPNIIRTMNSLGAGLDVGSLQELTAALAAGFSPAQISFVGPGKRDEDLTAAVNNGIEALVVESLSELERVGQICQHLDRTANIVLRINPLVFVDCLGTEVRGMPSQFGIDEEIIPTAFEYLRANPLLCLKGLHFYVGSQYFQANLLLKNFSKFLETAARLQEQWHSPFAILNLGGGFGIPYFVGQSELNLPDLRAGLYTLVHSENSKRLNHVQFQLELGRYLVAHAGTFVTRILYRKRSHGRTYLICDGGFASHATAVGVGQAVAKPFAMSLLPQTTRNSELESVAVVGPSCFAADVLATKQRLPVSVPGDLLCVHDSGAYGLKFSPTDFLSPPPTAELFC